jgi:RimJ/RimL family protein N-acetyltransferase
MMIVGDKIIIDVIDPRSLEWMRQRRNDPELRQYFREWKDISKDRQEIWYKERGNNTNKCHVYFEIREASKEKDKENHIDNLIGCMGLHYINWQLRSAEFGIYLDYTVRGKGYGKESLSMLFDYGFNEMNMHKIWAEVYNFNSAINVYTHGLGMKVDGVLRDNKFTKGKYHDSTMISILEDEWRK